MVWSNSLGLVAVRVLVDKKVTSIYRCVWWLCLLWPGLNRCGLVSICTLKIVLASTRCCHELTSAHFETFSSNGSQMKNFLFLTKPFITYIFFYIHLFDKFSGRPFQVELKETLQPRKVDVVRWVGPIKRPPGQAST